MELCFECGVATKEKHRQKPRKQKVCQKHLDGIVSRAMNLVMASIAGRKPAVSSHFSRGASAIHPRHLITWYLFHTDMEWETAKGNGLVSDIETLTREVLVVGKYPANDAARVTVSFTSDEDVQRKTGGDHRAYFQQTNSSRQN